jgi:predicted dehydrogenase
MAHDPNNVSRREFINTTAGAAAATAAGILASPTARAAGANQRLGVGLIGAGLRGRAHLDVLLRMFAEGRPVEPVAVCDVFNRHRDEKAEMLQHGYKTSGGRRVPGTRRKPLATGDYRQLLASRDVDVVVIATPDHWHGRMALEALRAGKHVYCERPLTHTVPEALQVVEAWRAAGLVTQVGVQRMSDGRWRAAHELVRSGGIGKVVQGQTEYYRNSGVGQWRSIGLARDMTPRNIDWEMFLGSRLGLAPSMPFDRAKFAQWRCYWSFGSGLFSELFVERLTQLLAAAGVRYPRRVTAGGGIFWEQDGRDVPDTATLVADYDEGLQMLVSATMCCDHKIEQCLRGHEATIVFDLSKDGFDVLPQRPQVTGAAAVRRQHVSAPRPADETYAHWENFAEAIQRGDPLHCNNPPDLAAAATVTVLMGAESYRQGRVLEWNGAAAVESGPQFAAGWEQRSQQRGAMRQPDESAAARQLDRPPSPAYQKLAGPWHSTNIDPAT